MSPSDHDPDASASATSLVARAPRAVAEFLRAETAGAAVLLAAAVAALIWSNSPWHGSYESVWHVSFHVRVGSERLGMDLHQAINDGLMALFFFVVGLEIKRELVEGELRDPRTAALPAMAAAGGMVVPALLFAAFNATSGTAGGWGIPMATDIAFALGLVAAFGSRLPDGVRLFLLTLAIVDDIGAIVVIALVYSGSVDLPALGGAIGVLAVVVLLRRLGVQRVAVYAGLGVVVWYLTYRSGVHATIAGVVLALLTPVRVAERLQHRLHPLTSFVVVPLFALANAGVHVDASTLSRPGPRAVALGVVVGLVVGKAAGIAGATWLGERLGIGRRPTDLAWPHVLAVAAVAGIGFTVSLFVAELAYPGSAGLVAAARTGVLAASVIAAVVGWLALRVVGGPRLDRVGGPR
jgi:NhaA family Na+:H+ antiporter